MLINRAATACFYCEREMDPSKKGTNQPLAPTKDHIIPVSGGGIKAKKNTLNSCIECNQFKGGLHPLDFLNRVKLFMKTRRTFREIPAYLLPTIACNLRHLLDGFVKPQGAKLFVIPSDKLPTSKIILSDQDLPAQPTK